MNVDSQINYVELPARDLDQVKHFYGEAFAWTFEDFGPEYTAFHGAGLDGGFFKAELASSAKSGSALVVLYADDLPATLERVKMHGATIAQEIFDFPGGQRFHFLDPVGNELAVWSAPSAADL